MMVEKCEGYLSQKDLQSAPVLLHVKQRNKKQLSK